MSVAPTRPRNLLSQDRARWRDGDAAFRTVVAATSGLVILIVAATTVFLILQGAPTLRQYGIGSFLGSDRWAPRKPLPLATGPTRTGPYRSSTARCSLR